MSAKREDINDTDVWYMYEVESMTMQEIADYYGTDAGTIYYRLHPEKLKEHTKKSKEANKRAARKYAKTENGKAALNRYMRSNKGKETLIKNRHNRHGLCYIPLNELFDGSEFHHYDKDHGIHMPAEIHRSIRHSLFTGKNMEAINKEAFKFLEWEMRDKQWEELEGGRGEY